MSLPGLLLAGQDRGVPVEREGSLLASFCADHEKGSEAVSPVAIVWPCPLAVDAYAAAGRDVGFPRPACPLCAGLLVFWSGYRRYVREAGRCRKIFVPRLRCARCGVSHALLSAFTLAWRLDTAEKGPRLHPAQWRGSPQTTNSSASRTFPKCRCHWKTAASLTRKPALS